MEFGGILGVSAIIIAIFLSTVVFVWQSNSQTGRIDARMDTLETKLEAKIEEQGRRVSDSQLEQARLSGVNSVLAGQTHTHETLGD